MRTELKRRKIIEKVENAQKRLLRVAFFLWVLNQNPDPYRFPTCCVIMVGHGTSMVCNSENKSLLLKTCLLILHTGMYTN